MKKQTAFFFILLLFTGNFLLAQRADAEAVLMKDQIRIGEQVELKLAVRYQEGSTKSIVEWPDFKDTLTRGIDIVKTDTIHTFLANRASVLYEQSRSVYITAFDSGMYLIPPQKFRVDNQDVETLPLMLHVTSVAVDTLKPIKDIKDIYNVPDAPVIPEPDTPIAWWWWAIIGGVVVVVVALVWFLTRKKNLAAVAPFTAQSLPHEKYLEQLLELSRRKPWLSGELKAYHVSLTAILRAWIVERYRIHAREMTTAEIIRTLHKEKADASAVMLLERVLRTADLVKFGKATPGNEENESVLQYAINFVQSTAVIPQPEPTPTPAQQ